MRLCVVRCNLRSKSNHLNPNPKVSKTGKTKQDVDGDEGEDVAEDEDEGEDVVVVEGEVVVAGVEVVVVTAL